MLQKSDFEEEEEERGPNLVGVTLSEERRKQIRKRRKRRRLHGKKMDEIWDRGVITLYTSTRTLYTVYKPYFIQ